MAARTVTVHRPCPEPATFVLWLTDSPRPGDVISPGLNCQVEWHRHDEEGDGLRHGRGHLQVNTSLTEEAQLDMSVIEGELKNWNFEMLLKWCDNIHQPNMINDPVVLQSYTHWMMSKMYFDMMSVLKDQSWLLWWRILPDLTAYELFLTEAAASINFTNSSAIRERLQRQGVKPQPGELVRWRNNNIQLFMVNDLILPTASAIYISDKGSCVIWHDLL